MPSIVTGEVTFDLLKFVWKINNFQMTCKKVSIADYLRSPELKTSDDTPIHLKLYPNGRNEASKDYLSLYLHIREYIRAQVIFQILDAEGKVAAHHTTNTMQTFASQSDFGTEKLALRDFVIDPANGILTGNKMLITCAITGHMGEIDVVKDEDSQQRFKEINKYEALINDVEFSDVSLISEGRALKVHRCILAKSSSVFADMFKAEKSQETSVEIGDIRYDVLVELIRFVYIGRVNNIYSLANELYAAADTYALHGLMDMCKEAMCKNFNVDSVIECIKFANRHRMDELKKRSIEFIVAHADEVTNKPDFKALPSELLCEICCAMSKKIKP
ncbi:speckle-type POZ protein B-like [Nasonia vitripennis]|uniref:BTB domain-containing protein n=1 Tax=Nasonia vitripennis TaxID=7425 RepID=A0A7M7IWL1_NASVI|nr:speckle-type POZ protein B-like [Nasonia vitripennis]